MTTGTAVIIKNNNEGDGAIVAPLQENGQGYRYCLYTPGYYDVAFADDYIDLLAVLIHGYRELNDDDQTVARIRYATSAAARTQAALILDKPEITISKAEMDILMAPRALPQPRADWWTCEMPLVVVTTSYEPYTKVPRPASGLGDVANADNLWWIDPTDEESLLTTLNQMDYIRLMENSDRDV